MNLLIELNIHVRSSLVAAKYIKQPTIYLYFVASTFTPFLSLINLDPGAMNS